MEMYVNMTLCNFFHAGSLEGQAKVHPTSKLILQQHSQLHARAVRNMSRTVVRVEIRAITLTCTLPCFVCRELSTSL